MYVRDVGIDLNRASRDRKLAWSSRRPARDSNRQESELLPTCSAIVHHGGAGTMFGALAHSVPQVILPQGADNFEHAAMCVAADVAESLRDWVGRR
jgi:UDP:flavonoid glycosyltransferase YjiC (YdhE family)